MRAAWSVSDWGRFARRHYGPHATVVARVRPESEPAMPAESEELKGFFEEKAGILEHGAGLPRPDAEIEAARITAGRRWRDTPSCCPRCPTGPAQSMPCPLWSTHARPGQGQARGAAGGRARDRRDRGSQGVFRGASRHPGARRRATPSRGRDKGRADHGPGTGGICGPACDRPWRDTPPCCPRCPTGQGR
jgi:hypothetical protein